MYLTQQSKSFDLVDNMALRWRKTMADTLDPGRTLQTLQESRDPSELSRVTGVTSLPVISISVVAPAASGTSSFPTS